MTPSTQPEIERKYEVPAGAEPGWDDMPRLKVEPEQDVRSLEATYYDTATGSLAAFGLALRRRRGGPDEGWHLKFRADGLKHEVHVPLLRTADRLPAQMRQLISGLLGDQPLEPLAVLRNERQVLQVHDPEHGRVAEICLDDVRGTESATGITRVWQEYEVELVNGTQADPQAVFDEIETVLLAAGLRPSASAAKIARTLGAEDDAEAVTVIGPDGEQLPGTQPEDSSEDRAEKASSKGKKGKKDKKDGGKKGKKDKKDGGKKTKRAEAAPEPESEPSTEQIVRTALLGAVRQIQWMDFLVRIGAEPAVHGLRRAHLRGPAHRARPGSGESPGSGRGRPDRARDEPGALRAARCRGRGAAAPAACPGRGGGPLPIGCRPAGDHGPGEPRGADHGCAPAPALQRAPGVAAGPGRDARSGAAQRVGC